MLKLIPLRSTPDPAIRYRTENTTRAPGKMIKARMTCRRY